MRASISLFAFNVLRLPLYSSLDMQGSPYSKTWRCAYNMYFFQFAVSFCPQLSQKSPKCHYSFENIFFSGFSMLSAVPECHKYESSKYVLPHVTNPRNFMKTVNNEIKLLLTSLPCGITVKGFEGRMVSDGWIQIIDPRLIIEQNLSNQVEIQKKGELSRKNYVTKTCVKAIIKLS